MNKKPLALLLAALLAVAPLFGCGRLLPVAPTAAQPTLALTLLEDGDGARQEPEAPQATLALPEGGGDAPDAPWEAEAAEPGFRQTPDPTAAPPHTHGATAEAIDEDGSYTARDDIALYLYVYGRLPNNFITKGEARALGWHGGGLDDYAYGKCVGGDRFGNYEGLLPEKNGRRYTECDVDTLHKRSRGAKRIVFSNDGLIYYTDDHYASFTLLYGEE